MAANTVSPRAARRAMGAPMQLSRSFASTLLVAAVAASPASGDMPRGASSATAPFAALGRTPGASAWQEELGGRLRLVTAPAGPDGQARAAIEIELEDGFKTYWWNPGPDGIPPQVSFFGSRNVADTRLTLPPPHVFRERTVTVGYTGTVRFPVEVSVSDPSRPYELAAAGVLGFCADVCVPVSFRFQAGPPADARTMAANAAGADQPLVEPSDTMRLDAARYDPAAGLLQVMATVPDTDVHLDLVVADPDGIVLPPAATRMRQLGTEALFTFDLSPRTRLKGGEMLDFTLIVARFGQAGRIGIQQRLAIETVE